VQYCSTCNKYNLDVNARVEYRFNDPKLLVVRDLSLRTIKTVKKFAIKYSEVKFVYVILKYENGTFLTCKRKFLIKQDKKNENV